MERHVGISLPRRRFARRRKGEMQLGKWSINRLASIYSQMRSGR
jgi:hypothetical protein